jgi:hypothetical protein
MVRRLLGTLWYELARVGGLNLRRDFGGIADILCIERGG